MDGIRALLARLGELTDEELANARQLVLDEFAKLDAEDPSTENTAALNELAEAGETIMGEQTTRAEAQAEAEAGRESARERIAAVAGESESESEGEEEAEAEGEPADEDAEEPEASEDDEEDETEVDEAEQREPVTASGKLGRLARRRRAKAGPESGEQESQRRRSVVVASGALRVQDQNKPIETREELAEAMATTLRRMSKNGPARGDVLVASAIYDYPEERQLGDSPEENTRKMELVARTLVDRETGALTATGGICQPVNVDYAVSTWATADRPLRDGLPAFQATRGGIRFVKPPDVGALAGATSIWTEATDAEPVEFTKAVLTIECGSEEHVFVEAIPTRLKFGNMFGKFAPEQVAANTDLAIAAAARVAEDNLLDLIAAQCVKGITNEVLLGATRDLITVIQQTAAAYRQIHRIPRSQTLTMIVPDWIKELIKIDRAREIGHGQDASLMVTEQEVIDLIRNCGVNPIFHLDGQGEAVEGGVSQVFATPAKGAIKPFPTKMISYFFAEGMMQLLDGGRLDLGVVRDSTLDAVNDYETFVEPFEGIAFRGFTGGALQLETSLCASGGTAGTVSTAGKCA